jgi:hypothetical protein
MITFTNDSGVIEVTDTSVSPPIIDRWLKDMLRIEQYVDIIRFTGTLEDAPGRKEYQLADESTAIAERQTLYEYLEDYGGGGGGGVQSVTGLYTDNTDPANPVIQIAVDGVTITGDGTVGNPLVSVGGGSALEILEDGVSIDANVDEINFKTPLKATQTAAGKVDVEVGIEKRINAAPTYYANGLVKINVQVYETSETFEERFEYNSDSQITKKETKDDLRGTWVRAEYTWTGNQLNLPTYTNIVAWSIT